MNKFNYVVYALLYIALLGLLGVLNVVVLKEMDWTLLTNPDFWFYQATSNFFYYAFFIITAMLNYDILEDTDVELADLEEKINDKRDSILTQNFRDYILNFNLQNKKKSHLEYVRIKIENHISKIKPKVFNELQTLPKTKWSIKTRKYQKKLDNLNKRMSDDWVDKNIIITKVKYPEITINEIYYGAVSYRARSSMLERKPLGKQIALKGGLLIFSLVGSIATQLLQPERFLSIEETIKSLSIMLIFITFNILFGVRASKQAHKTRLINTSTRLGIIYDYDKRPIHVEVEKKD
jgi:hypothetical protein